MSRLLLCAAVCAASLLLLLSGTEAATIAMDSAADAAYNDSWQPGDNGGSGWGGGWTFRNQGNTVLTTTNGSRGWFTGNSLGNNQPANSDSNGDGDINSPVVNRAWGVYSNATDQVYAIRPFAAPLAVGNTVKWDMDNGNINSGQVVGLRFLSNASDINSRVFEARFVGGDSFYSLVGNPSQNTTHGFSREGLHLEYTLTSASTYSIKITRKENNATATFTGTNVNANSIVALAFKNQFAGNGGAFDGFLNNISIMSPNVAPTVADAVINNVNASDPGMVMHTFTANDPDMDPLTWSNFQFGTYTAAYGGGAPNGPQPPGSVGATFNPSDQKFSWNTVGSPRGIYTWKVTASDGQGGSDEGMLTVHVTEVPEPASAALLTLAMCVAAGLCRHRSA
jgi:hypothetical protein